MLRVNKNDTDGWALPTNETAIWIGVSCLTPEVVSEKERKAKGRQYSQGICSQMFQSCFLWTLKSGIASYLLRKHQTRGIQNVWCGHPGAGLQRRPLFIGCLKKLGLVAWGRFEEVTSWGHWTDNGLLFPIGYNTAFLNKIIIIIPNNIIYNNMYIIISS